MSDQNSYERTPEFQKLGEGFQRRRFLLYHAPCLLGCGDRAGGKPNAQNRMSHRNRWREQIEQ